MVIQKNSSDFDTFVNSQQPTEAVAETEAVDWNKERDDWLTYLNALYQDIDTFLKPYIDSNRINSQYQEIELNEPDIGVYKAPRLILKIGRQEVIFDPIGTNLIGNKGRVDVLGPAGKARLILISRDATSARSMFRITAHVIGRGPAPSPPPTPPTQIDWVWKIVANSPAFEFIELTAESLFNMILEVTNG
jgi:hypothetical protein